MKLSEMLMQGVSYAFVVVLAIGAISFIYVLVTMGYRLLVEKEYLISISFLLLAAFLTIMLTIPILSYFGL